MGDGLSDWVVEMEAALDGEHDASVPCGPCVACCASSQFVVIGPEESDVLEHIPSELLFPAPRRPQGWVVLGYDSAGRCPMLTDVGCSIYEHRPRTCRTFDCRIFPATGTEIESTKPLIAERAARWRFEQNTAADIATAKALRDAADHVSAQTGDDEFADEAATPTGTAVTAVRIHRRFLPS